MERLNLVNFIFLVVLFVLAPRGALRTAREMRRAQEQGIAPPRVRVVLSTAFALGVIWILSLINAAAMGRSLFAVPSLGMREIGVGLGALCVLLLAIPLARLGRSPDEERRRLLHGLAPRNGREFAVFSAIAVLAGVAEEAAYRGVAIWILTPILGSPLPAIFLSALAFGVAHAVQGGRAMAIVFGVALVMHGVVYVTGTLVVAMVLHIACDLVAGALAGKRAKDLAAADAVQASPHGGPGITDRV